MKSIAVIASLALAGLACAAPARAQSYPDKPVHVVEIGRAHV